MSRVENGKSKRRDYKRENFPGLTVSYRGLVEYQTEIVSAWRTRDKLPFLSFSPFPVSPSPIVIYTSILGSIIFSLSLSLSFPSSFDTFARYIFATNSRIHCRGKILSGGRKSEFGFSSEYNRSNKYSWLARGYARASLHKYTRMRGIELHEM